MGSNLPIARLHGECGRVAMRLGIYLGECGVMRCCVGYFMGAVSPIRRTCSLENNHLRSLWLQRDTEAKAL
jgi:hypothetical protein